MYYSYYCTSESKRVNSRYVLLWLFNIGFLRHSLAEVDDRRT